MFPCLLFKKITPVEVRKMFVSLVLTVRGRFVYVLLEHGYRTAFDVPSTRTRETDQEEDVGGVMRLWVEETEFAEIEFGAVSAFVAISDYSFLADFAYNACVRESVGAGLEEGRWLSCYRSEQRV